MVQVSKSIVFSLVKVGKKLTKSLKRHPANAILPAADKNKVPLLGKGDLKPSNVYQEIKRLTPCHKWKERSWIHAMIFLVILVKNLKQCPYYSCIANYMGSDGAGSNI